MLSGAFMDNSKAESDRISRLLFLLVVESWGVATATEADFQELHQSVNAPSASEISCFA